MGCPLKAVLTLPISQPPRKRSANAGMLEPNLRPLPNGNWYSRLVVFVTGWSYADSAFSTLRLKKSCGAGKLPAGFSSEPAPLSIAFDQVNEFRKNNPAPKRC